MLELKNELSITDKVVISKYLEEVQRKIVENLRTMDLTGYGASTASGESEKMRIEETQFGANLWGVDYLYELENPLSPSEQKAKNYRSQWAAIKEWIDIKPILIEGDISSATLAGLIVRSIREKGTLAYQRFGNRPTGIISEAITDEDIEDLITELGETKLNEITEFLMRDFA